MSRGEFGGGPSYGTLSDSNVAVSYGRPSSSRYQGNKLFHHWIALSLTHSLPSIFINVYNFSNIRPLAKWL